MLATLMAAVLVQDGDVMRMMRYPDIHEDKVVFTFANDLWLGSTEGGIARRLTTHPGAEYLARFSPDGEHIAFTAFYDGNPDVYLIPAEGGEPERVTYQPGTDYMAGWTPEGDLAYTSSFQSALNETRLYIQDPDGTWPRSTPLYEVADLSFSPDGETVAFNRARSHTFNWRRYRGGTQGVISFYNFDENEYWELPHERENQWFPMWIEDSVYFVSDRDFGTVNLFRSDMRGDNIERLTDFDNADIRWPNTDGESIVWERNGFLETYDLDSGDVNRIDQRVVGDRIHTRPEFMNLAPYISTFSISPSGKRLAVEARGEIFSLPATSGEKRNLTNSPASRERWVQWSPTGENIAYLSDETGEYKIYIEPQMGGEPEMLETPEEHRLFSFAWSPDAESMVYRTTDGSAYLIDVESEETTFVYRNPRGFQAFTPAFSHDSTWLAYIKNEEGNSFPNAYLYDIVNDEHHPVTRGDFVVTSVDFDRTGKYLYLSSSRSFAPSIGAFEISTFQEPTTQRVYVTTLDASLPNPVQPAADEEPAGLEEQTEPSPEQPAEEALAEEAGEEMPEETGEEATDEPGVEEETSMPIDVEGLADRLVPLPWGPSGSYSVIGAKNGVFALSAGSLLKYDFNVQQPLTIIQGISGLSFTPDQSQFAYSSGGTIGIAPTRPGVNTQTGVVDVSEVSAIIDPELEWAQILSDVYRNYRDFFYDPELLGLDWDAIYEQYQEYLPYVASRRELNVVIGQFIGEMGTGHAYVSGGDLEDIPSSAPVGLLGADFRRQGNYLRFDKIYRGANWSEAFRAPLGEPGIDVEEGDYLLEINGREVNARMDMFELLLNTVGKQVTLTVNDRPTLSDARTVTVRPVGSESTLRYIDWVEENQEFVTEMSDGRIGYFHVPDTNVRGIIEFVKGYYAQQNKDAWVIDERYNGGGWIPTFFTDKLTRNTESAIKARDFLPDFVPTALDGPKAMLINQYAGSGGDMFPWLFREEGLGPLIGNRTWGGLVGISGLGVPIVDGGSVSVPSFGIYDPETGEWIAENVGIEPDIAVDERPDLRAQGDKPQLRTAVEYLLEELEDTEDEFVEPDFPVAEPGPSRS